MDKKIEEICLALIKISVYARRVEFRHKLEHSAFQLLDDIGSRNIGQAIKSLKAIKYLINFGKLIYEVEPINAEIINDQVNLALSSVSDLNKYEGYDYSNQDDIKEIFASSQSSLFAKHSKLGGKSKSGKKSGKSLADKQLSSDDISNPAMDPASNPASNPANESGNPNNINLKPDDSSDPAIRQTAIIEKIRSIGKPVQLKDVLTAFPDFSERTLRYDLQRACNQGILEKMGSGPITSYQIRVI